MIHLINTAKYFTKILLISCFTFLNAVIDFMGENL